MEGAHRVVYRLEVGCIPPGQQVLHTCDVRHCVRPDHLFVGTQKDNMTDMIKKGRAARGPALNHRPQDGERNHNAKLSDLQVAQMRELFGRGVAQRDLALCFNTTRANVHCIVRGKSRRKTSAA